MAKYRKRKNKSKLNINKIVGIFLFLIVLIFLIIIVKRAFFDNTSEETFQDNIISDQLLKEDNHITFTITALGDSLCHNTQYWDAYNSQTSEYDFSYVYEDIIEYTQNSDITIGSLETTFAGEEKGYSNYPTFNTPDSLATALKNIGVDIISLAGNHALDYGYAGLCRTIDILDNAGNHWGRS